MKNKQDAQKKIKGINKWLVQRRGSWDEALFSVWLCWVFPVKLRMVTMISLIIGKQKTKGSRCRVKRSSCDRIFRKIFHWLRQTYWSVMFKALLVRAEVSECKGGRESSGWSRSPIILPPCFDNSLYPQRTTSPQNVWESQCSSLSLSFPTTFFSTHFFSSFSLMMGDTGRAETVVMMEEGNDWCNYGCDDWQNDKCNYYVRWFGWQTVAGSGVTSSELVLS